jgi:hypothetical protein
MPLGVTGPRLFTPQPELRPPRLSVPGPDAEVAVQGYGCLVADPDDPGLAGLAADGDLPLRQVDVATLRVVRVVADRCQFGEPDAGGPEHRDDGGVPALSEGPARAGLLQGR